MDKKRTKKRPWPRWMIGIALLLIVATVGYLLSTGSYASTVAVDRERVSITPVVEQPFYEYINVTGQFQPRISFLLDVKVPGTVEQILAESGDRVETGEVLLKLANDDLRLEVMQRESQLIEQLNNQRQTALLLNQNNYNQREQLVEVRYQIDLQRKQYERNKQLLALRVAKIFPNVEEGRFRVEISLQPGLQKDHSFTHSRKDAGHAQRIVELFDGKTLLSEKAYLQK